MEPENTQADITGIKKTFFTVTPLSKYLAMLIFIAMPFVGFWFGYSYALEKVVEVENVIVKEIPSGDKEVKHYNLVEVAKSNQNILLDTLEIKKESSGQIVMEWSVSNGVFNTFPKDTTYVTFRVLPSGATYNDLSHQYEKVIGDGFKLSNTSYPFSLEYYEKNLWNETLQIGVSYRIVAELVYQPPYTCRPNNSKDCDPVYSEKDAALMNDAKKYVYVSEPIQLK